MNASTRKLPKPRTWGHHVADGTIAHDSRWLDGRGDVALYLSYTSGVAVGVVYDRNGEKYQLGMRRFLRDFVRVTDNAGPTLSVQASPDQEKKA